MRKMKKEKIILALALSYGVMTGAQSSVVFATAPTSGVIQQTTSGTNIVGAAVVDNSTSYDDNRAGILALNSGSVEVTTSGTVTVNTQYANSGGSRDNWGTAVYAASAGTVTIKGNLDYTTNSNTKFNPMLTSLGNTYADVTARGAGSTITITGNLKGNTDSRLAAVDALIGGTINVGGDIELYLSDSPNNNVTPALNNNTMAVLADNGSTVIVGGKIKVTGNEKDSRGLHATNGSTIKAASVDITVEGEGLYASGRNIPEIYSSGINGSTIEITGDAIVKVSTTGKTDSNGSAVQSNYGSTINIGGNAVVEVGSVGTNGKGVSAYTAWNGQNATVNVANNLKVTTGSQSGHALYVQNGGEINYGTGDITTTGKMAYGINATGSGTTGLGKITATTGLTKVNTSGQSAIGISSDGGTIELKNVEVTTTGFNGAGIVAEDWNGRNSTITMGDAKVTLSGVSSEAGTVTSTHAVGVFSAGSIIKANSFDITTTGINSAGIEVRDNSTASAAATKGGSITSATKTTINTAGSKGYGVIAYNKDTATTFNTVADLGEIEITTTGNTAHALYAYNNGKIIGTDLTITTSGQGASGVNAQSGAQVQVDSADITLHGNYGAAGFVRGLWAYGTDTKITVANDVKIVATGTYDKGLVAEANGYIKTGNIDIDIQNAASWSEGVLVNNGTLETGDAIVKNAGTPGSSGINVRSGSTVSMKDVEVSLTGSSDTYGILATSASTNLSVDSADVTIAGDASFGVLVSDHAVSNVAGNTKVVTNGASSEGIEVWGVGQFTTDTADLTTNGANSIGIKNYDNGTVTVSSGGTITADGAGSVALSTEGRVATDTPVINLTNVVVTAPVSNLAISGKGNGEINLTGSTVTGDVQQDESSTTFGGDINVNMTNTTLTGGTHQLSTAASLNMAMDNASLWNVTKTSDLGTFKNEGGTVDMVNPTGGAYETITMNKLEGTGGNYLMNADLGSQTDGDKMIVHSSDAGAGGTVQVYDKSIVTGNMVTGAKKLLMIVDDNATTQFTGARLHTGGLWDTDPTFERIGNDWYLVKVVKEQNVSTEVLKASLDAEQGLWKVALTDDTLRKRLGDLRYDETEDGIWARIKTGKAGGNKYSSSYQMYQVGYDKRDKDTNEEYDKNTAYGFAVEHTRNSSSYIAGNGKNSMTGLTLYATNYRGKDLFHTYSDIVLRADKVRSSMHSYDVIADSLEHDTWAYSASYEAGKTYSDKDNKGYFVEPQAQLTFGYMRGGDYKTDYGVDVHRDGVHSLLGRLGVVLGRRIHEIDEKHDKSDYYVKANLYHEFAGDNASYLSVINSYGDREYATHYGENKDTWYELGFGGNWRIKSKTHLYGDVLKTFGAVHNIKWQVNAGVRWEF